MQKRIKIIEYERITTYAPEEGVFSLRCDRGWLWVQRFAFWILKKIGATRISPVVTFKSHIIDSEKFSENLYRSRKSILEMGNREPTTLLIGAEEYAELMGGPLARSMIDFEVDIHSNYRGNPRIKGMRVVVVPWMIGMLPVTNEILGI